MIGLYSISLMDIHECPPMAMTLSTGWYFHNQSAGSSIWAEKDTYQQRWLIWENNLDMSEWLQCIDSYT